MLVIIITHGVTGIDVAVDTPTGVSEAAGRRVSVGCCVDIIGGVLEGRPGACVPAGTTKPEAVGEAGGGAEYGT